MGKSNTEFNWRVARSFALAACLAGGCMAAGSQAQAQAASATQGSEIGRAACRGRGEISVGGGFFKKKKKEIRYVLRNFKTIDIQHERMLIVRPCNRHVMYPIPLNGMKSQTYVCATARTYITFCVLY